MILWFFTRIIEACIKKFTQCEVETLQNVPITLNLFSEVLAIYPVSSLIHAGPAVRKTCVLVNPAHSVCCVLGFRKRHLFGKITSLLTPLLVHGLYTFLYTLYSQYTHKHEYAENVHDTVRTKEWEMICRKQLAVFTPRLRCFSFPQRQMLTPMLFRRNIGLSNGDYQLPSVCRVEEVEDSLTRAPISHHLLRLVHWDECFHVCMWITSYRTLVRFLKPQLSSDVRNWRQ